MRTRRSLIEDARKHAAPAPEAKAPGPQKRLHILQGDDVTTPASVIKGADHHDLKLPTALLVQVFATANAAMECMSDADVTNGENEDVRWMIHVLCPDETLRTRIISQAQRAAADVMARVRTDATTKQAAE